MCQSFIIEMRDNDKHEYDRQHSQEATKFDKLQDEQIYISHTIQSSDLIITQSREI